MDQKHITFAYTPSAPRFSHDPCSTTRKCKTKKTPVPRVETTTWNVTVQSLEFQQQWDAIQQLHAHPGVVSTDSYIRLLLAHVRAKLSGYKQQDLDKHIYQADDFISLEQTIAQLHESQCKCHYCAQPVFMLYEMVREPTQWTLDRIDNDLGHNATNVVIACLSCNLSRRTQKKDTFMFVKNMVVIRNGHPEQT